MVSHSYISRELSYLLKKGVGLLMVLFCSVACKQELNDAPSYARYLNNPQKGLIQSRRVDGIVFSLQYLPHAYLALKEAGSDRDKIKGLLHEYKGNLTFLMKISIGAKDKWPFVQEFSQRLEMMRFEIKALFRLKIGGKRYSPVLCSVENSLSLARSAYLTIVFDGGTFDLDRQKDDLQIEFSDRILNTGTQVFLLQHKAIASIPSLNLSKK